MAATTQLQRKHSPMAVAGVVAFYWSVSISMVFTNKYLVGTKFASYDLSIFVAWAQCVSTVLVAIGICMFRQYVLGHDIRLPPLDKSIIMNSDIIMLYFMFTGMLTFNNLTLKFVGVAFFQVARSLTLIFVVILSALLLRKVASLKVVACCLLVVLGFALGVDQEKLAGTLSIKGVCYGVVTSLFVAMNGIYTKRGLNLVKNSSFAITYYMNLGAAILFVPIVLFTGQFSTAITEKGDDGSFFILLLFSGALSFFIGFASILQIDYTSPVTHHISNNSKSVMQTLLAVIIYEEHKSLLWWCSNLLVIFGALSYTLVKMNEEQQNKAPEKELDVEGSDASPLTIKAGSEVVKT